MIGMVAGLKKGEQNRQKSQITPLKMKNDSFLCTF
jgi:hypothetical protein